MSDKLDGAAGRLFGTLARTDRKMQIGFGKQLFMKFGRKELLRIPSGR